MSVRTPTERNFRRARVKPGRRTRVGARVSWAIARRALAIGLFVFGAYQSALFAFTTPLLRVDRIAVQGHARLSSGQVQALVDDLRGTSILRADLEAFRRRLVEAPWIADAELRRVLPSTVEVFVSERRPIGLCRVGEELYLIDETGTLIDQYGPQYAEFDLPVIDGLVAGAGGMQAAIDPARAELAARVIAAVSRRSDLAARVSQVDVTELQNAVVLLDGDPALLHLGNDRFLERLQSYVELSSTIRETVAEIDYVDMRFERRVYVRPAAASSARTPRPAPQRLPPTRRF